MAPKVMARSLIAAAVSLASLGTAIAQDWPTRPINLVVPYAAGGPVDTVARILAARLGEVLGQQVIIENVGGAGGMTGAARVAKSQPDGYTMLLSGSAVLAIIPTLYKRPLYDAVNDFVHVTLFSDSARVLLTRKDFPATNLSEFIAYAKANQAKLQYGSAGAGSGMHVCALLLDTAMGTHITHVPYRGSAPAMQDLIGGRVDYVAEQISTALPLIEGNAVKAIATLGLDRAPGLDKPSDRAGARTPWPRLRRLGRAVVSQGNAGRHRAPPRRGLQYSGRDAVGPRAIQGHRRDRSGTRAQNPGVSGQVRAGRDRALGRTDQGERG